MIILLLVKVLSNSILINYGAGSYSSNANTYKAFPLKFTSLNSYGLTANLYTSSNTNGNSVTILNPTASGFYIFERHSGSYEAGSFKFIAIGY